MSHRRTEETELILVLWAAVKGVQQFVNTTDGTAQQHFDRRELLRQYQEGTEPTVPRTPQPTQESALLVLQLWLSIENGLGGISEIPVGTQLLLAANCLPFLNDTGFSLPVFGHQPFMIWEHKQLYRLVTSTFLHSDLKHLVANLGSLVQSGSCLEAKCGVTKFAASVTSLGLAASFLDGKIFVLCFCEHSHMLRLDSVALQRYTAAFPTRDLVISKGTSCRLL
jgi:membrane associated rhomboid family serine protease